MTDRTQVAIVGAGPAGLLLGQLLHRAGIETVILERQSRSHCEARIRAGVLEHATRQLLIDAGVGERMRREGLVHGGILLQFDGERHRIPIDELTGGRTVTIYGQTELVKDLIVARLGNGAPLAFEVAEVAVDGIDGDRPVVRYRDRDRREHELRADFVAGCDGFHGICRTLIGDHLLTSWERTYPFAWLGILAEVPPSTDELIYARHERGFALHSMRSPSVSRLYLQVPPDEQLHRWPDDRIWDELATRLHVDGFALTTGPILETSVTPMRSFVAAPMRRGRLLLAGDAAHIVPPTGAKGLNLAVADVAVLADALTGACARGLQNGVDEYSERCLRRVWRAQHFSWWMTSMLHIDPDDDAYGSQLARSQLRYVCGSQAAAMTLAENYAGLGY